MRDVKTRTLVECGLMVALATVLNVIAIYHMPQGGSITAASMMPVALASFRHGPKWGLLTGVAFGLIQLMQGWEDVAACPAIWMIPLCILLDYLMGFGVMGLAQPIGAPIKNRTASVAVGTAVAGLGRYFCSFLSGIIIWGEYAPEDMPIWLYSLTYNGSYMIPEIIVTTVAAVLVMSVLDRSKLGKS